MNLERWTGRLKGHPELEQELGHAVARFVEESDEYGVPHDHHGFYDQTCRTIAQRGLHGSENGDLWLALDQGRLAAFALTTLSRDIDDKACLWINSAYIGLGFRRGEHLRRWYQTLEDYAREKNCAHVLFPSSRSPRAYIRALGRQWHPYAVILKKDLE